MTRAIIYSRKWSGAKDETVVLVYLTSSRCQQWVAPIHVFCWHFPRIKMKETNLKDLIHKRGKWVLMQWPTVKANLVTRATTGLSRKGNETEKVFCMRDMWGGMKRETPRVTSVSSWLRTRHELGNKGRLVCLRRRSEVEMCVCECVEESWGGGVPLGKTRSGLRLLWVSTWHSRTKKVKNSPPLVWWGNYLLALAHFCVCRCV